MSGKLTIPILSGLLLLSGCMSFNPARQDYVYQEALYLTTRDDTGNEEPSKRYNGLRGETQYGVAMVAIDPEPALSSFAQAQPNRMLEQQQLLRRQPLQQVRSLEESTFLETIADYAGQGGIPNEALIFIHGYKRSFGDSVENVAQLRYQLAFPGPVIAFSWPSTDSVSGYIADAENLEWSTPSLRQLIATLADRFPGIRLHILAHSLGNRALVRILSEISDAGTAPGDCAIGQVIFIAPDFDRDIFMRDVAPVLGGMPFHKTLYVSSEDFPLIASAAFFQYPRLGDSRDGPPLIKGVETIDVSDAISYFNGHGYYEADRATIDDLYHLIRLGLPAAERPGLIEVDTGDGPYWRLQPAPAAGGQ